ncbi:MAG: alpha/beta hydrolase [Acidimicrobiia bacterium]
MSRVRIARPKLMSAVLAGALLLGACSVVSDEGGEVSVEPIESSTTIESSSPTSNSSTGTTMDPPSDGVGTALIDQQLSWDDCGPDLECTEIIVPLDYDDLSGPTISLNVERVPAARPKDRIGVLLVNPGGPGVAGTLLTEAASQIYSDDLLRRFDIVAWDPRGTGASSPVDCFTNLDDYFTMDPTPDDEAEKQAGLALSKQWAEQCHENAGDDLLAHVSTQDTARDIDEIRKLLGEEQISWFGFSYGSELGATYATMFPDRVRAAVLDASIDPTLTYYDGLLEQATQQERLLSKILGDCSADTKCAFHNGGKAEAAFDELMADLDATPIVAKGASGRPKVGQGIAVVATIQVMYVPSSWSALTDALAEAQAGDGRGLLDLYDSYLERSPSGSFTDAIEGLFAIGCLDDGDPGAVADADAIRPTLLKASPRLGDAFLYLNPCLYWPVKPVPRPDITGKGAGTILVVGSTGDPITPLASTKGMAEALEGGTLLVRDGEGHTSYASGNSCIDKAIDSYLIKLTAPADGTICKD